MVCSRTSEHRHQVKVLDLLRITGLKQSQQSGIPLKQSLSTGRLSDFSISVYGEHFFFEASGGVTAEEEAAERAYPSC